LKIYTESEEIEEPTTRRETWENNMLYEGKYEVDIYKFTVKYSFSGNVLLLKVQPNSYTHSISLPQPELTVNKDKISFSFDLYKKDAEDFKREKGNHYNNTFR
jgi:hemolysin activation/secretion protein